MFSLSDIRGEAHPASYRRGKELQETGGVFDFTYDMYLSKELPMADVSAKVRGNDQEYYDVSATVDEEFGDVTEYRCNCEASYNYGGMCKHCIAMLLHYLSQRSPMDILRVKQENGKTEKKEVVPKEALLHTTPSLKSLLNQ